MDIKLTLAELAEEYHGSDRVTQLKMLGKFARAFDIEIMTPFIDVEQGVQHDSSYPDEDEKADFKCMICARSSVIPDTRDGNPVNTLRYYHPEYCQNENCDKHYCYECSQIWMKYMDVVCDEDREEDMTITLCEECQHLPTISCDDRNYRVEKESLEKPERLKISIA